MEQSIIDLDDILTVLPKLNSDELQQIDGRIHMLVALRGSKVSKPASTVDYIKKVFLMLANKYVEVPSPTALAQDAFRIDTKLTETARQIEEFYHELGLERKQLPKLIKIVVECADSKADESTMIKYFRTLLWWTKDVKLLVDQCYPGYLSSGLFIPMVIDH